MRQISLTTGNYIFKEGDPVKNIYIIIKGETVVTKQFSIMKSQYND